MCVHYAHEIRAGSDDEIIRMIGCADCNGRGWFCKQPFALYNKQYFQCKTCLDAYRKDQSEIKDIAGKGVV